MLSYIALVFIIHDWTEQLKSNVVITCVSIFIISSSSSIITIINNTILMIIIVLLLVSLW